MKIAQDGWGFIILGIAVAAAGALSVRAFGALSIVVAVLGGGFAGFSAYFFRDPERPLPTDPNKIYSPGDGTVLSVVKENGDGETVRIFLSIFNVHIQRAPCAGKVERVDYRTGSFKAAMVDGARENERNIVELAVRNRPEKVAVEQIAGLIARRIRCWIKAGDEIAAGARYGLIQFGSQAAVHLPPSARATVKPGDKVAAGITEIAQWIADK
ncbi:MAG: phosphatidylserine decarboxylase [Elusimicrobiota bacterium]